MPNEIISADVREADAQWCENRAILYRAEVRYAAYPEERPIREARVAIYSRLAELSRAATKQDAAIAKLRGFLSVYDVNSNAAAEFWAEHGEDDRQLESARERAIDDVIAAAREVVGGGA